MIKFDVAYYDSTEESLFRSSGLGSRFDPIVRSGLEIDELDLIAAAMFMEQKQKPGWFTREDLGDRVLSRIDQFDDYFSTGNGTLSARHDATDMGQNTEWMGVGASIAVMDEAYKTHAADWEKRPVGSVKDLDFETRVASIGSSMIAVESKGSVVDQVQNKSSNISKHKDKIKKKKAVQRPTRPNDVLVGTIAAIPTDQAQRARIWLVDPPLDDATADPRKFKLLARLRYYRNLLRILGKAHMLIALNSRIGAIERTTNIAELDGAPLLNADAEIFETPPSLIQNRSHSVDERLSVRTWVRQDEFLIIGMDLAVIPILTRQKHDSILGWESRIAQISRSREFVLLLRPEDASRIGSTQPAGRQRDDGLRPYRATVKCSISRAGLVVGRSRKA